MKYYKVQTINCKVIYNTIQYEFIKLYNKDVKGVFIPI